MTKTNYTKVDSILDNELRRMSVEYEMNQSKKPAATETSGGAEAGGTTPLDKAQKRLVAALQRDLKRLKLADHSKMYASLEMKKADLRKKIESPENLTPEDWEVLKCIKEKIDKYRSEIKEKLPQESNDAIVEAARNKHINKRFNVNEKWLPLH